MNIARDIQTSTSDYPKEICLVLYTIGCNMRCKFCHNMQLAKGVFVGCNEWDTLEKLQEKKSFTDYLTITGGEPTYQKGLEMFLYHASQLGFKIKLDTNGLRPDILANCLWAKTVRYVAMDIKTDPDRYDQNALFEGRKRDNIVDRIKASIQALAHSSISHEYRTSAIPETCTKEDFLKIAEYINMCYEHTSNIPDWYIQTVRPTPYNEFSLYKNTELDAIAAECQNSYPRLKVIRR